MPGPRKPLLDPAPFGERTESRRKRLAVWIAAFLVLSALNVLLFPFSRVGGLVQVALLAGLFVVLVFIPSDARERERAIDTEAAATALGITFWTAVQWSVIATGFDLPETIHPGFVALFILGSYLLAKALIRLRYR